MSFFDPIDHIQRHSESFLHPQTYEEFMEYAAGCRDQLQVYLHMEENRIGIDEPKFWLALLENLKQKCEYKLIIKKLTQLKQSSVLFQKPQFIKILNFEESLTTELQYEIRKRKINRSRTVRQFGLTSISAILKKTRKIGNGSFQIYVDKESRQNYKLNDLSEYILDEMKDFVKMKVEKYEKQRAHRPYSFLGQKQNILKIWSKELIQANKRNSQMVPISDISNGRLSVQQRGGDKRQSAFMGKISSNINEQNPEKMAPMTPKANRKSTFNDSLTHPEIKKVTSSVKEEFSGTKSVFTTPKMKNPTISKDLIKANGKYRDRDYEDESESEFEDFEEIQRDFRKVVQSDGFQTDSYLLQQDVLRCEESQRQIDFQNQSEEEYSETRYEELNTGFFDSSDSIESYESESYYQQSQVLNCLKSSNTFESLDSNDQNKFSNEVISNQEPERNFKKQPILQALIFPDSYQNEEGTKTISRSGSNLSISEIQKAPTVSSDFQSLDDFLEIGSENNFAQLDDHQNLILETMRKKKAHELRQQEKKKENFNCDGFYSEIKRRSKLSHISEEQSYNSERKFTSIKRKESGLYQESESKRKKSFQKTPENGK